jgi:hypothetical protein
MYPDPYSPEALSLDQYGLLPEIKVELPSIRKRREKHFVPAIPERLFDRLVALPGKCLGVYLILLQRSCMEKRNAVALTSTRLNRCGITRKQKQRALEILEKHDLVRVEKRGRNNPLVHLLEVKNSV